MLKQTLTRIARPLDGGATQFQPIIERIGSASTVLIGEATHGTREFYEARAALTRELISDHGFAAVVVEGDWPDAYRVNRFVRGVARGRGGVDEGVDETAEAALSDFVRFPTWMWRNRAVAEFVTWLRNYNESHAAADQAGFYGMDLYSLYRSIDEVLAFLDDIDPHAAARARDRYSCFERFDRRAEIYGRAAGLGLHPSCEQAAVAQLIELRRRTEAWVKAEGVAAVDEGFFVDRNAVLVRDAERYYRAMFGGRVTSWNLRDEHMMDTCEALREQLGARGSQLKLVVWAHNSHVQDARATTWRQLGQVSLGQLMRERHGDDEVVLVGFTGHVGTVTAASDWDEEAATFMLRPSLEHSWEHGLHDIGRALGRTRFVLISREAGEALEGVRLTRAVGVVYRPQTERESHYYASRIGHQYDVILHYDETRAVQPLERWPGGAPEPVGEPSETYPFGL